MVTLRHMNIFAETVCYVEFYTHMRVHAIKYKYQRIICTLACACKECVSTQVFVGVSHVCSLVLFKHKPGQTSVL